jgi:hypothetical protein
MKHEQALLREFGGNVENMGGTGGKLRASISFRLTGEG